MIRAVLTTEPIDGTKESAAITCVDCGARVTFAGTVRSPNAGEDVLRLEYEAYETVAVEQMRRIAEEVATNLGLHDVCVIHRTGTVLPGETAFYVMSTSPHRTAALRGTAEIVDRVKDEAAIWKLEVSANGSEWAGKNTSKNAYGSGDNDE